MKTIVGITGTTSVGKSAVAVELAKMLNTDVISADSMQIYKGMDIGTAKITSDEMRGVIHRMLDIIEPCENYSSFLYQQQASQIIDSMTTAPIVAGGTGFYFDSLIYPPEFGNVDAAKRSQLKQLYEQQGIEAIIDLLKKLDVDAYNQIDLNNPKRVMRAVEIALSGEKRSKGTVRQCEPRYALKLFVLERKRDSLYTQIDKRVDAMVEIGLVDEVKNLVSKYGVCDTSAFQAIGYKEVIEYFNGSITLNDAIARIKLNTRHYAKRQIAYFKKMNVLKRINVEGLSAYEIALQINNFLLTEPSYS